MVYLVPGDVLDGELILACGVLCKGGIQLKHTWLGLGLKLIPPQELHGGVGGGVHGERHTYLIRDNNASEKREQ